LTEQGRAVADEAARLCASMENELLAGLADLERKFLLELLDKVARTAQVG
jgi:DNA-binding MarR family transcriptional regulator